MNRHQIKDFLDYNHEFTFSFKQFNHTYLNDIQQQSHLDYFYEHFDFKSYFSYKV